MLVKAWRWIMDRYGLEPIWDKVLDRQVPKDPWYHGDGMALMALLTILVVTGLCLALGYCPAMDEAYLSVLNITHEQTLGWFVRGMHYWSGGLMVVFMFLHVCRQLFNGGYKAPREATWQLGVVLLFIVLLTSLLGYVLRWDERGLAGLRVALATLRSTPYIGEQLALTFQGGPEISSLTVSRVYVLHVILLPLVIFALVGYHLYLVILHGTTTMGERDEPIETVEEQRELYQEQAEHPVKGEVFYPTAVSKLSPLPIAAATLAIGLTLIVGPRDLLRPASTAPLAPSISAENSPINADSHELASEEWWFAWYSGLIALLPPEVASVFMWLFPLSAFIFLIMLPFLDRGPLRGWSNRPIASTLVVLLILSILGLSWLRYQSPWTGRPSAIPPSIPIGVVLAADAEHGRNLFPLHGCASCHSVAGSGKAKVGPDLARTSHFFSQSELSHYILNPPKGIAMPGYAGRLSDQDLDRIVAFVLVAQTFPRTEE